MISGGISRHDTSSLAGLGIGGLLIVGEAVHYIEECYSDPSIRVAEIAKRVNVERG